MVVSNYLKLVARKFYRDKLYTLINLAGLSLAVACCLILGIYLHSELTYDQHNVNHKRIYRIVQELTNNGEPQPFARASQVLAPMMAEEFEEIEDYARLYSLPAAFISSGGKTFSWNHIFIADASLFEMFTHEVIYGDIETVLSDDNNIAVSETFAQRHFGNTNPVGEIVTTEDSPAMTIGLVFADLPENTHIKYDILFSANTRPAVRIPTDLSERRQRLSGGNSFSYLLLSEDFDVADFEAMADAFIERHFVPAFRNAPFTIRYWLEPLADIHLHSDGLLYDRPTGNLAYVFALIAVALFILFVACINYINLATARSIQQAKQVGMRKILGAEKASLVIQFLAESIFLALISMIIGVIIVELVTTFAPVNELFGKTIELNLSEHPQILLWLALFGLAIGLITGLYPALYLSSWAPLSILVSDQSSGSANASLRKALVLAQFTVSVAVVACTLLMADQMRFISNKALGYEKENRLAIRMIGWDLIQKSSVIKNELLQHPNILGVTTARSIPGWLGALDLLEVENNQGIVEAKRLSFAEIDLDYLETMGIEIVEGRDFSGNLLTDYGAWIVNETWVEQMGWDEPLGKTIEEGRVIGVVQDFHFLSLHNELDPIALRYFVDVSNRSRVFLARLQRYMIVNIAGEDIRETRSYLEGEFNDFDPRHSFDAWFIDEGLEFQYRSDQRLMNLISIFAGICIFIACLGLFGLASFTTEQRRKEIGIRKTLGASTSQIIMLLSKNILSLVAIGALIGCVAAYFVIDYWLGNFAYRVDLSILPYLIATAAALTVAYVTVALQSYRTAQADPVDALRYE